ncbi:bifunctional hydroxymethylpyrimidine kinase/phosphomethylpyrimidine kinase [Deltaproteobacteria bacterium PRO3]|nr:bifunctional hydroxymethylpyrimidine kinase/phosphomethylpyrimidine kinase [Deltaproteobacteria bacterium PRO3]
MVRRPISKTARLAPLLAVGGLDPSGHAGVLADLRVFERLGFEGRVALSAVTAQSEREFFAWEPVPIPLFRAQLEAAGDRVLGVKIGMLGTPGHLEALLHWLRRRRPRLVVWDPVLRSSTGARLFRGKASDPNLARLLRLCDAFTPNIPEAEWFLKRRLAGETPSEAAAKALFDRGKKPGRVVVLKGGHAADPKTAIDWVRTGTQSRALRARRRPGSRRGSGCSFAAALLAGLALGRDPIAAARLAKRHVLRHLFD